MFFFLSLRTIAKKRKERNRMQLLYISTFMFHKIGKQTLALPSCADSFFEKYLDVFDTVRVLGEDTKRYLDQSSLIQMKNPNIQVEIIPANTNPRDFKNDLVLRKILTDEISKAEAILIKPSTRRGMMAIGIAEKYKKPYMIEMTGDIHNALLQNPSRIRRMYAPVLYKQIRNRIQNCEFGLYVSNYYLQNKYPIKGKMCGCSDANISKLKPEILEERIKRIDDTELEKRVNLALVGFYQGTGKGVDTAIRALSRLDERYHLNILGNGTEENRHYWIEYAEKRGVIGRIHFPQPLSSSKDVIKWLKSMDIFVLPTRSEGLSRAMLEAMSTALPCIVTDICTMPELVSKEWLHPLGDDKLLAEKIRAMVSDKSLMKKAAKQNFDRVADYEFEKLRIKRNLFLKEFKDYCIKMDEK